jgi:RNA polymerase sigma-70 factor (ECF subfamily)
VSASSRLAADLDRFGEQQVMTDRELLDRFIAENDPNTFRVLVERHGPMVLAVCRGILRGEHDVEDAFQNTFMTLARRACTIKHLETIGPWLHRVAVRLARKTRRKLFSSHMHDYILSGRDREYHTELPLDSHAPLLREELNRLPERYRLPLVLCYLEGKSNREAADQLRWPVGTVKGRLSRARQTLRERLERRGVCLA